MEKRIAFGFHLILLIIFIPSLVLNQDKLPEKYEKWIMEEVVYIITSNEKKIFHELETDKERDLFIEEFWKHRDPTPGTPKNEFKEEHYRRIEYANKKFGRETPTRGWRTDRGRIYIILGEAIEIQKYHHYAEVYPLEMWYYQGNPRLGQVPYFRLTFFKKHGTGDFELYDPFTDGPKSLTPLISMYGHPSGIDMEDAVAYGILKKQVSIEVADASLSCFPGTAARDFGTGKTFRLPSSILAGKVQKYPQKKVQDDYAIEFLEHKAIVEVNYSVNYMTNQSQIKVLQGESGLFFVNYSIEPETLSVDYYKDKYFTNLKVTCRVTDSMEKTIFQQEKNFPVEIEKEQLEKIKDRPFNLFDSFPLIPGNYKLNLLLENTVSKEFTTIEKDIIVPGAESFQMSSLLLAHKVDKNSPFYQSHKAYQIGNLQLYPSPNRKFYKKDKLYLFFQIYGLDQKFEEKYNLKFIFLKGDQQIHTVTKEIKEYKNGHNYLEEFSLEKFSPGRYKVSIALIDSNQKEILTEREELSISSKQLPDSWIISQTNPPGNDPIYSFLLGNQFIKKGNITKAHDELEKAFIAKPDSLDNALSYAKVLLMLKEFQKVKEILLPFAKEKKENFALYYYLGKSAYELGELEETIFYYQKVLSYKGNVVEILNYIGECYYLLGDNDHAIQAWKKSLEINPKQEEIKKIIEIIK